MAKVLDGAICPKCGKPISLERGIEIGNIFQLGTKYTKSMHMEYVDANGKLQTPIMGCYGIGVGRLLASVIEDNHDDHGPIWPMSVAPWQIHICSLNNQKEEVRAAAEELYSALSGKYDVIMDDRKGSAGDSVCGCGPARCAGTRGCEPARTLQTVRLRLQRATRA